MITYKGREYQRRKTKIILKDGRELVVSFTAVIEPATHHNEGMMHFVDFKYMLDDVEIHPLATPLEVTPDDLEKALNDADEDTSYSFDYLYPPVEPSDT